MLYLQYHPNDSSSSIIQQIFEKYVYNPVSSTDTTLTPEIKKFHGICNGIKKVIVHLKLTTDFLQELFTNIMAYMFQLFRSRHNSHATLLVKYIHGCLCTLYSSQFTFNHFTYSNSSYTYYCGHFPLYL